MTDTYAYGKYREQAVSTYTPGELIILLYDRAVLNMNMAIRHIGRKTPGEAHTCIRKAEDIVIYLRSILDPKYPISGMLNRCYTTVLGQLSQANIRKEQEPLEDAVRAMRTLRDAWKQIEIQGHTGGPEGGNGT